MPMPTVTRSNNNAENLEFIEVIDTNFTNMSLPNFVRKLHNDKLRNPETNIMMDFQPLATIWRVFRYSNDS